MGSRISAISYYLPEDILTNEELSKIYPDWSEVKILDKTGIAKRHISADDEFVTDMAISAVEKLFAEYDVDRSQIDMLILATQSPDYILPTSACIIQHSLGLSINIGAFDFNLGCSAYIYGLAMAKSFISGGVAKCILLVTSEVYTKHIHPMDRSARTIFGDGAAASLVIEDDIEHIHAFCLGTDGSGAENLIIPAGAMRNPKTIKTAHEYSDGENTRTKENLYMNGQEIFGFTIKTVPKLVKDVLEKNALVMDNIDLFVFHQANKYMLDYLRKKIKIPEERFYVNLEDTGNLVSSSIPVALQRAAQEGRLQNGNRVMLVGFGVGLSWGATIIDWHICQR